MTLPRPTHGAASCPDASLRAAGDEFPELRPEALRKAEAVLADAMDHDDETLLEAAKAVLTFGRDVVTIKRAETIIELLKRQAA